MTDRVLRDIMGKRLTSKDRKAILEAAKAAPPESDHIVAAALACNVSVWVARAVLSGQP